MAENHKPDLDEITRVLFPNYPKPHEIAAFFEAVGAAHTAWQGVEAALYLLFERAVAPGRPGAAACGFHTLQFSGKVLVTDAAVRFALLDSPKRKVKRLTLEWGELVQKARNQSTPRNHFAHSQAQTYSHAPKDRRIQLAPQSYDFRYAAGLIKRRTYKLSDIRVHTENFRKFSNKLTAFLEKISPPGASRARRRRRKQPPKAA